MLKCSPESGVSGLSRTCARTRSAVSEEHEQRPGIEDRSLERPLQVLDCHQPSRQIERHPDRVEAHLVGVGSLRALDQPAAGHLAHPGLLARVQRVERTARAGGQTAGLDLTERERVPVEGDDVQLAPPGPVIALDDLKSSADEMLGGELFARLPKAGFEVVART